MKLSRSTKINGRTLLVALGYSALAFSVSAGAEEQETPYTMTAIVDASYGDRVTAGDYEQAIQRITAKNYHQRDSFEANTNLCVAYTKTGAIGQATATCEAAIAEIQARMRFEMSRTDFALALSNRGVLRAVQGQEDLARQDFVEAMKLKSGLAAPSTNLARLDAKDYAESYSAN